MTCAAVQPVGGADRVDVAVPGVNLDAEFGQPADVHVDLARADVAAARHARRAPARSARRAGRAPRSTRASARRARRAPRSWSTSVASISSAWSVRTTRAPRPASTSVMTSTSAMSGTLVMRETPGASSAAAMSLSAEFLAPSTRTSPDSGRPPRTMMDSMRVRIPYLSVGRRVDRRHACRRDLAGTRERAPSPRVTDGASPPPRVRPAERMRLALRAAALLGDA